MWLGSLLLLALFGAGCEPADDDFVEDATPSPTSASTPTATAPPAPTRSPSPTGEPEPEPVATPAPEWLGTRVLEPGPTGFPPPQPTPDELMPRSVATVDVLPPPSGDAFEVEVQPVDPAVLNRSTWHVGCPVASEDLRYLTVTFWGFDQAHHTGEVLVHVDAVDTVVAVFAAMHEARFPLEEVRLITDEDLDAPPTGDGNVTSAFVCRDSRGGGWSEHAFGRALDVNPFHNPYDAQRSAGRVVLPELATAYTDRTLGLPGMLVDGDPVVAAVREAGWPWGGDYRSLSDPMHLSATGR